MEIAYSFVPLDKLLWQIVLFGMIETVLDELGEDGLELFESGTFRHVC